MLLLAALIVLALVFTGVIKVGKFDPSAVVVKEIAKHTGAGKKWDKLTAYSDKQDDVVSALTGDDTCKNQVPVCAYEMVSKCNANTDDVLTEPSGFNCSDLVNK